MSPRLTVLTTTLDEKGNADVAPFSFVIPVSFDPPLVMLSLGPNKHSYNNIIRRKEFVINIPSGDMIDKVMIAGGSYDPEMSKIDKAGLRIRKADKVGPPILIDCPISMECYVNETKKAGDHVMIIGEVVALHVKEGITDEKDRLRVDLVKPPLHIAEDKFFTPSQ